MIQKRLAALLVGIAFSMGCGGAMGGGSFSGSASVSVDAQIKVPLADLPPKYAAWVVEAEGYLYAVDLAYSRYIAARAELAAALGVAADANAIANFLRNAIKVKTKLVCSPPNFNASLAANCSAKASAQASGNAGSGGSSGQASAGIQANCKAKASLSLSPGKCTLQTTVSEHPILSNASTWARIERNMKIILQLSAANVHLDGRGADINLRGMKLYVQSVTDLAKTPSLVLQLSRIQAELKKGAEATGAANDKQGAMNNELRIMGGAINGQFPDLRGSVSAG